MRGTKPSRNSWPDDGEAAIAEIRRRTKCAVVGDAVRVLAAVPGCLESFLSSLRPTFESGRVESAADQLREVGATEAESTLSFSDHLQWLSDRDYGQEDARQIRYVVEVFYNVEPVRAVLAAGATAWLESTTQSPGDLGSECVREETQADLTGQIQFVDESHLPECLSPFVDRWGGPCHLFLKALAIWPAYVDHVWIELGPALERAEYARAVAAVREAAECVSRELPISAFKPDLCARCRAAIPSLKRCLRASCHVLVLSCALRRMFIRAETDARSRRAEMGDS